MTEKTPIIATLTEVSGRGKFRDLGEFEFTALPRVRDEVALIFQESPTAIQIFVVTGCNHLPRPVNAVSAVNGAVQAASVQVTVQFSHVEEQQG
jgi:hypothetical protein